MSDNNIYINYVEDQVSNSKDIKEKKPKNKKHHPLTIVVLVLDIIALLGLFVLYGPFDNFRNFWITSATATMSHKYLAHIFYSNDTINSVLSANYVESFNNSSDSSDINYNNNTDNYESIYDEQILKKDKDNDLYKLIKIEENGTTGYLVAIYDSSRISLQSSSKMAVGGQQLLDFAKAKKAIIAINASGFTVNSGTKAVTPTGTVIKNGKILSIGDGTGYDNGGLIGFDKNHTLMLTMDNPAKAIKNGIVDAVEFGPFLIMNGVPAKIKGNGGLGYAPRTAIAQRQDGIVLFLVFDGRNLGKNMGASMVDIINIFTRYKAYNAANLDGGGSSTLVINNKLINEPSGYNYSGSRYLPNAWMVN